MNPDHPAPLTTPAEPAQNPNSAIAQVQGAAVNGYSETLQTATANSGLKENVDTHE
jgi:hypothetical protein